MFPAKKTTTKKDEPLWKRAYWTGWDQNPYLCGKLSIPKVVTKTPKTSKIETMKAKFPNLLIIVKTTETPSSPSHDDLSRDEDLMNF